MSSENDTPRKKLLDEIRRLRTDADKGREPELLNSRLGTRRYSVAALLERITDQFISEHGGGSEALQTATTEADRLKLILGTVDYVLSVESIQIDQKDKAEIIRRVYTELFTYGPLDDLFADENITTITIEGADKAAVRRGHSDLEPLGILFDNENHLKRIIKRLLLDSGAELDEDNPIIETGLQVNGRRISVNIATPPVTFFTSVDIRLHPKERPTLTGMVEAGLMSEDAALLLEAIARSPHGVVIVGEPESGKTIMLGMLASLMQTCENVTAVERAGELLLPEDVERLQVQWQADKPRTFSDQIQTALATNKVECMLLDEIRTDEAQAVRPLLAEDDVPRQLWAFRGPAHTTRLLSALGMLARRSTLEPGERETLVRNLYERLPFVITLRRRPGHLQLHSISAWQFSTPDADYPDLIELMNQGWEGIEKTGNRPVRSLELPENFWGSDHDDA